MDHRARRIAKKRIMPSCYVVETVKKRPRLDSSLKHSTCQEKRKKISSRQWQLRRQQYLGIQAKNNEQAGLTQDFDKKPLIYSYMHQEGNRVLQLLDQRAYNRIQNFEQMKCFICTKNLKNNLHMMRHYKAHMMRDMSFVHELEDLLTCRFCQAMFGTPFELQNHIDQLHAPGSSTVCKICAKNMDSLKDLRLHLTRVHVSGEMPYHCDVCHFRSALYKDLMDHFNTVHKDGQSVLCPYCLRAFRIVQQNYVRHLHSHLNKSVRRCDSCQLVFVKPTDLAHHRANSHGFSNLSEQDGAISVLEVVDLEQERETDGISSAEESLICLNVVPPRLDYTGLQIITQLGYCCIECDYPMEMRNHFRRYLMCPMCRYTSNCGTAFTEHVVKSHVTDSTVSANRLKPAHMVTQFECQCGFVDGNGNKLVSHMIDCGSSSAYRSPRLLDYVTEAEIGNRDIIISHDLGFRERSDVIPYQEASSAKLFVASLVDGIIERACKQMECISNCYMDLVRKWQQSNHIKKLYPVSNVLQNSTLDVDNNRYSLRPKKRRHLWWTEARGTKVAPTKETKSEKQNQKTYTRVKKQESLSVQGCCTPSATVEHHKCKFLRGLDLCPLPSISPASQISRTDAQAMGHVRRRTGLVHRSAESSSLHDKWTMKRWNNASILPSSDLTNQKNLKVISEDKYSVRHVLGLLLDTVVENVSFDPSTVARPVSSEYSPVNSAILEGLVKDTLEKVLSNVCKSLAFPWKLSPTPNTKQSGLAFNEEAIIDRNNCTADSILENRVESVSKTVPNTLSCMDSTLHSNTFDGKVSANHSIMSEDVVYSVPSIILSEVSPPGMAEICHQRIDKQMFANSSTSETKSAADNVSVSQTITAENVSDAIKIWHSTSNEEMMDIKKTASKDVVSSVPEAALSSSAVEICQSKNDRKIIDDADKYQMDGASETAMISDSQFCSSCVFENSKNAKEIMDFVPDTVSLKSPHRNHNCPSKNNEKFSVVSDEHDIKMLLEELISLVSVTSQCILKPFRKSFGRHHKEQHDEICYQKNAGQISSATIDKFDDSASQASEAVDKVVKAVVQRLVNDVEAGTNQLDPIDISINRVVSLWSKEVIDNCDYVTKNSILCYEKCRKNYLKNPETSYLSTGPSRTLDSVDMTINKVLSSLFPTRKPAAASSASATEQSVSAKLKSESMNHDLGSKVVNAQHNMYCKQLDAAGALLKMAHVTHPNVIRFNIAKPLPPLSPLKPNVTHSMLANEKRLKMCAVTVANVAGKNATDIKPKSTSDVRFSPKVVAVYGANELNKLGNVRLDSNSSPISNQQGRVKCSPIKISPVKFACKGTVTDMNKDVYRVEDKNFEPKFIVVPKGKLRLPSCKKSEAPLTTTLATTHMMNNKQNKPQTFVPSSGGKPSESLFSLLSKMPKVQSFKMPTPGKGNSNLSSGQKECHSSASTSKSGSVKNNSLPLLVQIPKSSVNDTNLPSPCMKIEQNAQSLNTYTLKIRDPRTGTPIHVRLSSPNKPLLLKILSSPPRIKETDQLPQNKPTVHELDKDEVKNKYDCHTKSPKIKVIKKLGLNAGPHCKKLLHKPWLKTSYNDELSLCDNEDYTDTFQENVINYTLLKGIHSAASVFGVFPRIISRWVYQKHHGKKPSPKEVSATLKSLTSTEKKISLSSPKKCTKVNRKFVRRRVRLGHVGNKYSENFKIEACRYADQHGPLAASRHMGISYPTLYLWRRRRDAAAKMSKSSETQNILLNSRVTSERSSNTNFTKKSKHLIDETDSKCHSPDSISTLPYERSDLSDLDSLSRSTSSASFEESKMSSLEDTQEKMNDTRRSLEGEQETGENAVLRNMPKNKVETVNVDGKAVGSVEHFDAAETPSCHVPVQYETDMVTNGKEKTKKRRKPVGDDSQHSELLSHNDEFSHITSLPKQKKLVVDKVIQRDDSLKLVFKLRRPEAGAASPRTRIPGKKRHGFRRRTYPWKVRVSASRYAVDHSIMEASDTFQIPPSTLLTWVNNKFYDYDMDNNIFGKRKVFPVAVRQEVAKFALENSILAAVEKYKILPGTVAGWLSCRRIQERKEKEKNEKLVKVSEEKEEEEVTPAEDLVA